VAPDTGVPEAVSKYPEMPLATPFVITGEILANVTAIPVFVSGVLGNTTNSDEDGRVELTVTRAHPTTIIISTKATKARDCLPTLRFALDRSLTAISAHSTRLATLATVTCKLKFFGL
jgi:hypothetical protein